MPVIHNAQLASIANARPLPPPTNHPYVSSLNVPVRLYTRQHRASSECSDITSVASPLHPSVSAACSRAPASHTPSRPPTMLATIPNLLEHDLNMSRSDDLGEVLDRLAGPATDHDMEFFKLEDDHQPTPLSAIQRLVLPGLTAADDSRGAIRGNLQTQDVVARSRDSPRRVTLLTRWITPPDRSYGVSPFHRGQLSPLSDEGRRQAVQQVTALPSPESKPLESWWDDFISEQGLEGASLQPDRMLADQTQSSPMPDSPTPLPRPFSMPATKRGMSAKRAAERLSDECRKPLRRPLGELPQERLTPSVAHLVQCASPPTVGTLPPVAQAQPGNSSQLTYSTPINNNRASGGRLNSELGYGTLNIEVEAELEPKRTCPDFSGLDMLAAAALGHHSSSRAASFDPTLQNTTPSVESRCESVPTELELGMKETTVELAPLAVKQESIATQKVIERDQSYEVVRNLSRDRAISSSLSPPPDSPPSSRIPQELNSILTLNERQVPRSAGEQGHNLSRRISRPSQNTVTEMNVRGPKRKVGLLECIGDEEGKLYTKRKAPEGTVKVASTKIYPIHYTAAEDSLLLCLAIDCLGKEDLETISTQYKSLGPVRRTAQAIKNRLQLTLRSRLFKLAVGEENADGPSEQ